MGHTPVAASVRFDAVVPHFRVRDVALTAEYYRDVLGFEVVGYWDGEEVHQDTTRPALFGIVRRNQVSIHFNRVDPADLPAKPGDGGYDVYFDVTGLDALADDLRARGAELLDGPVDRVYGRRELVVRDCDGRMLAFGEMTGRRATTSN